MIGPFLAGVPVVVLGLALLPWAYAAAVNLAMRHGAWRLLRALGRAAPFLLGSKHGGHLAFLCEGLGLQETGRIAESSALAKARVAETDVPTWTRNLAIDILISAGAYDTALSAEPPMTMPANAREALSLALIQIDLAEADYNLGRWDAAETRLRGLDLACWHFPIARAGLVQQRAWIAAHRNRAVQALELCDSMKPRWLPPTYRTEYHFTRAAALLAAGRIDDAEAALGQAERLARRLSSATPSSCARALRRPAEIGSAQSVFAGTVPTMPFVGRAALASCFGREL